MEQVGLNDVRGGVKRIRVMVLELVRMRICTLSSYHERRKSRRALVMAMPGRTQRVW